MPEAEDFTANQTTANKLLYCETTVLQLISAMSSALYVLCTCFVLVRLASADTPYGAGVMEIEIPQPPSCNDSGELCALIPVPNTSNKFVKHCCPENSNCCPKNDGTYSCCPKSCPYCCADGTKCCKYVCISNSFCWSSPPITTTMGP